MKNSVGCRRCFYNYSGCTKRFCIIIAVAEKAIEIIIIITLIYFSTKKDELVNTHRQVNCIDQPNTNKTAKHKQNNNNIKQNVLCLE